MLFNLPAHAYTPESVSRLPQSVTNILQRYKIPVSTISVYVVDLDTGQPVILLNENTPRNPASAIKILTTYAGLELLGPAYLWETRFYLDGVLSNGTLKGNLIFQGGGDPFLSRESFWHMLHTLQVRGLKYIEGDFIIDHSLFETENGSTGDFDGRPYHTYNVFPHAALLNFTAQDFFIIPQKNSVLVYADPPADNIIIRNNLKLASGKCWAPGTVTNMNVSPQGSQVIVEFTGNYPAACGEQVIQRSVIPPDQFVYGVFKALWEEMGGTINGHYRSGVVPASGKPFYTETSRPLTDVIYGINKYSNNVMARQLLLTIGQIKVGAPGSKAAGAQAIKQWLHDIGIHAPELILDNGSGLSRHERISAGTMGKLLEHAWHGPLQPEFLSSLPIAGRDGTMRKRLNGKIPVGNIRIKTGLLNDVRSMAGYVKSRNNRHFVIVILHNHTGIQNTTGTLIQDELLKWLYEK
ncbi:MAG: D-alanyl-D-alanine carboxypeptidase/D-alanyl-D-alanine-endopeptidase [Gammaproteobacteria bacterium RIFCSPLOWO2_12_47_11]|nr:MAG: D-alanyl-D-alanine carboxypeptidase/D-alanyl-D-alanine-endopeptidase [Gammaproteobacteria bacterium RIFCSPLOWO2_12_47_11]